MHARFAALALAAIVGLPLRQFARNVNAHPGSRRNLIGEHPDDQLVRATSSELRVTRDTPPTFIRGFGLGQGDAALSMWTTMCESWLRRRGWLG